MTTPAGAVHLAAAYRFFVPLILMTELNMISKSVIHAFLARSATPSVTLAAFHTAFTFYFMLASVTELATYLSLSYVESRLHMRRVASFMLAVVAVPFAAAQVFAFTEAGNWLYGEVFGLSAGATTEARLTTFVFSLSAPVLVARGVAFALLMLDRHTLPITCSTLVRLLSLAISLPLWSMVVSGALVGAAALVTCMVCETVFAWSFARRQAAALPAVTDEPPGAAQMWRFGWPLAVNQAAELGTAFVANLFIGRLTQADLALAAFGVVHGLASLLFSPLRNLMQTAQTLASSRADVRVLVWFALQLAAAFSLLALVLFNTAAADLVLGRIMGLGATLAGYAKPALGIAFLLAPCWAVAALSRGLLAKSRTTGLMAASGALRIATVVVVGAWVFVSPGVNGAVLGLVGWMLAYALEAGLLGSRLLTRPHHRYDG